MKEMLTGERVVNSKSTSQFDCLSFFLLEGDDWLGLNEFCTQKTQVLG